MGLIDRWVTFPYAFTVLIFLQALTGPLELVRALRVKIQINRANGDTSMKLGKIDQNTIFYNLAESSKKLDPSMTSL